MKPLSKGNPFSGEQQLYTVSEVAEILHISRVTVYRLVHEGGLPHVRIGRPYRISHETLCKWFSGEFDHLFKPHHRGRR